MPEDMLVRLRLNEYGRPVVWSVDTHFTEEAYWSHESVYARKSDAERAAQSVRETFADIRVRVTWMEVGL